MSAHTADGSTRPQFGRGRGARQCTVLQRECPVFSGSSVQCKCSEVVPMATRFYHMQRHCYRHAAAGRLSRTRTLVGLPLSQSRVWSMRHQPIAITVVSGRRGAKVQNRRGLVAVKLKARSCRVAAFIDAHREPTRASPADLMCCDSPLGAAGWPRS
jgi:hypothetical protein